MKQRIICRSNKNFVKITIKFIGENKFVIRYLCIFTHQKSLTKNFIYEINA